MKYIILILIKIYKKIISPVLRYFFPSSGCRFYPTCSDYTCQAIKKNGFLKGIYKGVKRLIRCHPFSKGGYDPL